MTVKAVKINIKKNGFTLVELSIVLVIIGLLIGGILVGQNLIETAKIQSQYRQFEQFNIATSNFKLKFLSLPGDSNKLSPPGNNNGSIVDLSESSATRFTGEASNFWKHLSETGFQPEKKIYTNNLTSGEITRDNIPIATYDKNYAIGIVGFTSSGQYNHFLSLSDYFSSNNSGYTSFVNFGIPKGSITGLVGLTFDKKYDDGIYNTGNIRSESVGISFGTNPCSYNSTTLSSTSKSCHLRFKLLSGY